MVKPAVEAWLKKLPEDLQKSPWAKLAESLAESIDNDKTSATAKALITPRLVEVLDRLRADAPEERQQEDPLDELKQRRHRKSAAADSL